MESRALKIAQVVGSPDGGVMSCVMNFYRRIDKDRFKFTFFTYAPSRYDEEIKALGGEIVVFPKVTKVFSSIAKLIKLFKEGNYDIVHVHLTTLSVFPLYAAKKAGIKRRINHAHTSTDIRDGRFLIKTILTPLSVAYATDTAGCSEYCNRRLYGNRPSFLMHNAVDTERFAPLSDSLPKNVVGTVGRLVQQKNQNFLIQAFAELLKKVPEAKLYILGEGELKEKLQKTIKKYRLEGKAEILDERADVEKFYESISVFCLPSIYEGLPVVGVEAQVKGLPCIFSDKITREAAVGGKVIFLPLDKKLWAEETASFLDGKRYINEISDSYDINNEVKRLEKFYCGEKK